ncbi:Ankyrin-3 [Mycena venus]|uniref:Ankyrin-3 n=1 Tax=Mycena venus TaxID=2733690 RepID=A0A8H6Y5C2_9AGAR|nr:Ankyrin-3 [Mycena venus]
MASLAFAYGSFGDILESIKLIAKIVKLIQNGAVSNECTQIGKELESFSSELNHLSTILQSTPPLPQFLVDRLQAESALRDLVLSKFKAKIAASRSFFGKVRWAISEEKDVADFRRKLAERRAALSGVVDQINLIGQSRVQGLVNGVGEQVRLGNDRIQDGIGRQLQDQNQILSRVRGGVDDVGEQVRLGIDQVQARVSGVDRQLIAQERKLKQYQISDFEEKLWKWLEFPPRMAGMQHETQKLHHKGTGKWFLDGSEFNAWKDKPGFLWIEGQSGTGKTVLSSIVIQKLVDDPQRFIQGTGVAFFYFDFRDQLKQRVEIMLRSIILQLSAQSPHPYAALDLQYEISKGQTLPTYQDLVDVLETLLSEIGRTYIILDALDEYKDIVLLIQFISRLRSWTKSDPHVPLTSQPREIFATAFEDIPQETLGFTTTQSDIHLFVSSELSRNPGLEQFSQQVENVATKVVEKSSGM